MKRAAYLVALSGCFGGTAVELELQMPAPAVASQYTPGCVQAVEVWLNGDRYPLDQDDAVRDCIPIANAATATWDDVHASIRGQFEGDFPESGLSGVEVYGYAGACDAQNREDFDLIFFAEEAYTGGDKLVIPVTPNLSCATEEVRVRPIDVLELLTTNDCLVSGWTDGKMALATLSPYPFTTELDWWGGQAGALIAPDGTATFRAGTKVGPQTCLATANYTDEWDAVSCVGPAEQRACAMGTEIEAAMIDLDIATASQDLPKVTKWGALVIGAVWNGTPIAGARVTLDAASKDLGEVVYFDLPAGPVTALTPLPNNTSTGPKGLFGVYTQSMVTIEITSPDGTKTVTRQIGGYASDTSSTVLVKM